MCTTTIPEGEPRLPFSARLPSDLWAASVDGEVYVYHSSAGKLVVVFKTWRGKGFNVEGFLYTTEPFGSTDITSNSYGHSIFIMNPIELTLEKKINSNWYRVSYRLD